MNSQHLPDVSGLCAAEKARAARTARRRTGSEVSLIFGAGGAAIAVAEFVAKFPVSTYVSNLSGMGQTAAWFFTSFLVSAICAVFHAVRLPAKVKRAQAVHAAVQHSQQQTRRVEIEQKMKALSE